MFSNLKTRHKKIKTSFFTNSKNRISRGFISKMFLSGIQVSSLTTTSEFLHDPNCPPSCISLFNKLAFGCQFYCPWKWTKGKINETENPWIGLNLKELQEKHFSAKHNFCYLYRADISEWIQFLSWRKFLCFIKYSRIVHKKMWISETQ